MLCPNLTLSRTPPTVTCLVTQLQSPPTQVSDLLVVEARGAGSLSGVPHPDPGLAMLARILAQHAPSSPQVPSRTTGTEQQQPEHTRSATGFWLFRAPCLTRNQLIFVLIGDKGTAGIAGGRVDLAAVGSLSSWGEGWIM